MKITKEWLEENEKYCLPDVEHLDGFELLILQKKLRQHPEDANFLSAVLTEIGKRQKIHFFAKEMTEEEVKQKLAEKIK